MNQTGLTVRELQEKDIDALSGYWIKSENAFLEGMGVDLNKRLSKEQWEQMLLGQLNLPVEQKRSYCIVWELEGKLVGHSNTNPTFFGEEAFMHLHLWNSEIRKKGLGTEFLKLTIPCFFKKLQLKRLYSEPYALNPAPSRTLPKLGFEFEKEYITVPGPICFEQPVKRWVLSKEKFMERYHHE